MQTKKMDSGLSDDLMGEYTKVNGRMGSNTEEELILMELEKRGKAIGNTEK